MKLIVQEDKTGCAFACVAMLTGVRYQQVKRVASQLHIEVQDPLLGSDTKHIRTLLTHYSLSASSGTTPFKSWDHLPSLALLAIKWHKPHHRAFWHWVVFWRGPEGPVVLDPKKSLQKHVRTDFGRIKPKWFLTVTRRSTTSKVIT